MLIFIIVLAVVILFGPNIINYFNAKKDYNSCKLVAERTARVKVLSDNAREIEKFIENNIKLLSEKSMNSLISKLEVLKIDKIITEDGIKRRIEDLKDYDFESGSYKETSPDKARR